jgi:hypothetical protein
MYVIKEDPKSSSFLQSEKEKTVTVPLSIRKPKANAFVPIDTKSNDVVGSGRHGEYIPPIPVD